MKKIIIQKPKLTNEYDDFLFQKCFLSFVDKTRSVAVIVYGRVLHIYLSHSKMHIVEIECIST